MANLDPFLKWYLIGAGISLLIQLMFMYTSPRVTVKMMIGYVLNTTLSWGCILTFICQSIIEVLEKHHKNVTLWETKAYKEQKEKEKKGQYHKGIVH